MHQSEHTFQLFCVLGMWFKLGTFSQYIRCLNSARQGVRQGRTSGPDWISVCKSPGWGPWPSVRWSSLSLRGDLSACLPSLPSGQRGAPCPDGGRSLGRPGQSALKSRCPNAELCLSSLTAQVPFGELFFWSCIVPHVQALNYMTISGEIYSRPSGHVLL